jgi:hypothetical protein
MKYDNINYINSETLIAEVKQELKTYFEAGAVSEVLIPTFIDQALRKLKVLVLKPEEAIVRFENFKSELPYDFSMLDYAVSYESDIYWETGAQTFSGYWYKGITGECSVCDPCHPTVETYETISVVSPGYRITLKHPRWVRVYFDSTSLCTDNCENLKVASTDIIKVGNNKKLTATFESGCIYVRYFSRPMDDNHIPMVPEILEVEEYVKAYLKYKFFEQMWHSVMDESTKQIESKLQYYKREQYDKLQAAFNFLMTKSKQQIADSIVRTRNRFSKFHIR